MGKVSENTASKVTDELRKESDVWWYKGWCGEWGIMNFNR
jgi:hypothetical protein